MLDKSTGCIMTMLVYPDAFLYKSQVIFEAAKYDNSSQRKYLGVGNKHICHLCDIHELFIVYLTSTDNREYTMPQHN